MESNLANCNGFYNENNNSTVGNYFPRHSSSNSSPGNSNCSSRGTVVSANISSGSSNSSTSSTQQQSSAGSNSSLSPNRSVNQWNTSTSTVATPQQNSHQSQQQNSQSQQQNPQPQQQQRHHHTPQQHHIHHQQQQEYLLQHNMTTVSNSHSIFGNGFYSRSTNTQWGIQNLAACYQRMQQQQHHGNENVYARSFHSNAGTLDNEQLNVNVNGIAEQQHTQQHPHQHLQPNHKRFNIYTGKSGNTKDICGDDKFKEDGDPWSVEAQAAFLGPNLWDKTLPYDADLKVTQYADLDEFLSENNIPDGLTGTHLNHQVGLGHRPEALTHSTGLPLSLGHITTKRERSPSPSDCVSPDTISPPSPAESTFSFTSSGREFDPRTRVFSDEELKPQPMIKKSRKQFVPDELKDDKYWARRRKNNIAAKRSRDARRQKENQIAMRARYLEKENSTLHQEVEQLKQENMELRARLSKYQEV